MLWCGVCGADSTEDVTIEDIDPLFKNILEFDLKDNKTTVSLCTMRNGREAASCRASATSGRQTALRSSESISFVLSQTMPHPRHVTCCCCCRHSNHVRQSSVLGRCYAWRAADATVDLALSYRPTAWLDVHSSWVTSLWFCIMLLSIFETVDWNNKITILADHKD